MDIPIGDEEKKDGSDEFGKVVDALHNKQALPSLRTYQGDMAEFIKEKNESVISVAVKEKERKDKREEKKIQTGEIKISPRPKEGRFKTNATMILLSMLLLAGGFVGYIYVADVLQSDPVPKVALEKTIIPYNDSVILASITDENLGPELLKVIPGNGISLVKISGLDGLPIQTAKSFFDLLKTPLPFTLSRTLRGDYAVGTISQNGEVSPFVVITVNDFGQAFSGMLDWEENIAKDLSFLNNMGTTTGSFVWKDIIVKNKDTRGLVNEKGRSKIAYTFLDKNTLLIIGNISAIGEISSLYTSRSVAR